MRRSQAARLGVLTVGAAATAIAVGFGWIVIGLVGAGCAATETPDQSSCDSTTTRAIEVAAVAACVASPVVGTVWSFVVGRWRPVIGGMLAGAAVVLLLVGMIL